MPSRNWHPKSRHGCTQCKKRHIKCDLKQTGCDKCNSRGIVCDFQQQQPRTENTSCTIVVHSDRYRYPTASSDRTQLYSVGKLLCLVENNELMHSWEPILAAHVQKHSFLKHAFRALAILRSRAMTPSVRRDNYIDGYLHHIAATNNFRSHVATVGNPSWIPTVMFTMAIIILEIRGFVRDQTPQSLVNVLTTLRSSAKLVESIAADFIRRQQVRGRLQDTFVRENPWAQYATEQHIQELKRAIIALGIDSDQLGAHHQQSISSLKKWIMDTQCHPRTWQHIIQWPATLTDDFIDSVRLGEPVSWLQCYFWASTLSNAPKSWFFEGWRGSVPLYLQKNITRAGVLGLFDQGS